MNISIIIDNTNTLPAATNLSTPPKACVTDDSSADAGNSNSNTNINIAIHINITISIIITIINNHDNITIIKLIFAFLSFSALSCRPGRPRSLGRELLYILYYELYAIHYILYTTYFMQYKVYAAYYILYTVYYMLNHIYYILYAICYLFGLPGY